MAQSTPAGSGYEGDRFLQRLTVFALRFRYGHPANFALLCLLDYIVDLCCLPVVARISYAVSHGHKAGPNLALALVDIVGDFRGERVYPTPLRSISLGAL